MLQNVAISKGNLALFGTTRLLKNLKTLLTIIQGHKLKYMQFSVETEGVLEIEVSLVSDPALWKSTLEYHGVYKMPQTVIRTMPLQPEIEVFFD